MENKNYVIFTSEEGYTCTYEELTYGHYLSSCPDKPFCLVPGGRIFNAPFKNYVDIYGEVVSPPYYLYVYIIAD